jgi:hypothetical protein
MAAEYPFAIQERAYGGEYGVSFWSSGINITIGAYLRFDVPIMGSIPFYSPP